MNPLPALTFAALNFAALTMPSLPVNNSSTTPMGHSVSLIRLNDNNISYGQAVRFGVVFLLYVRPANDHWSVSWQSHWRRLSSAQVNELLYHLSPLQHLLGKGDCLRDRNTLGYLRSKVPHFRFSIFVTFTLSVKSPVTERMTTSKTCTDLVSTPVRMAILRKLVLFALALIKLIAVDEV